MAEDKNIENRLIDFFSQYSVEEVNSGVGKKALLEIFGAKHRDELLNNKKYNQIYTPIMQVRHQLDESIKNYAGRDQVQSCLALLYDKKRFGKKCEHELEILNGIIDNGNENCLFKSWNETEQGFYNEVYSIIVEWYDVFFSYTSRDWRETNNEFKPLIIHAFGEDVYNTKEIKRKNFLAELIVHYLELKGVKPFYDQKEIVYGDKFGKKILKHCKSCYVFVQLIEEEVFHVPNEKTNWCHKEFIEFDAGSRNWSERWCESDKSYLNRFYYFLTHQPDIVFPPEIHPTYQDWYDNIQGTRYFTINSKLDSNLDLKRKVIELTREILKTKKQILKICLGKFI